MPKYDFLRLRVQVCLVCLMITGIFAVNAFAQSAAVPAAKQKTTEQTRKLQIIGEVEPVIIKAADMTLPARIDTGATTSSLDARDIQTFERDGKKWVRFTVIDRRNKKEKQIEGRLSRMVEITRHGAAPQHRPAVKLKVVLGNVELFREFTLTDRSAFNYPVLIGRNLLQGKFLVDVGRKNTTAPMSETKK